MAVVEMLTFRLARDADEDAFLDADRRAQTEFVYHQRGVLRRTTVRGAGGEWLVITLWGSHNDADASDAASRHDPAVARLTALWDLSSVTVKRYETLD